jgi:hypothetical protein
MLLYTFSPKLSSLRIRSSKVIAVNYPNIHFYLFSLISRTNTEAQLHCIYFLSSSSRPSSLCQLEVYINEAKKKGEAATKKLYS